MLNNFKQTYNFLLNLDHGRVNTYHTDNIKAFLAYVDNPQKKFKAIHVAGTSGKGSVCQMMSTILKATGYKTGLTISPYLIDPLERIQINNKQISKPEFIKLTNKYKKQLVEFKLTYFEAFIALAFVYFAQQKTDYVVVETGLGGRYDATNVFEDPALAIVTNIGLDHVNVLGHTRKKIALEKEQIIKNKNKALTSSKYISRAKFVNNKKYKKISSDKSRLVTTNFKYKNKIYKLKLLGEYQIQNAVLAIEAAKFLKIADKYIRKGLLAAKHQGRFDVLSKKPLTVVDGAHNPEKVKAFISSLQNIVDFKEYNKKYLLIAIKEHKDYKKMLKFIVPLFDEIVITTFNKGFDAKILKKQVLKIDKNKRAVIALNSKKAYKKLQKKAKKDDILVVTGSLYMIGDVMA